MKSKRTVEITVLFNVLYILLSDLTKRLFQIVIELIAEGDIHLSRFR